MTDYVWVYVTAKDSKQALDIGRALVEERLAACVNLLGSIRSLYRWEGRLNDAREAAFVAKTRASLVSEVSARVKELHSYACPCVVALPLAGGNPDFLSWIGEQTKQPDDAKRQSLRRPPRSPARKRK